VLSVFAVALLGNTASGQRAPALATARNHPAIQYDTRTPTDRIAALAKRLAAGEAKLAFNPDNGYLAATLEVLAIPIESQVVVFSETSVQADLITSKNPRALFFDDGVAVGWVRGAGTLEMAAHDPQQGIVFYTLDQRQTAKPQLTRQTSCLTCHLSQNTQNVPGMLTFTTQSIPQDKYSYASGFQTDHRTPIPERWGGWFVTGQAGGLHLGNTEVPQSLRPPTGAALRPRVLDSLKGVVDLRGFPSAHSDVVALMMLEHQATMTNLLTRVGWEARIAEYKPTSARSSTPLGPGPSTPLGPGPSTSLGPGPGQAADALNDAVVDLVDYLLFVDGAPLPAGMRGSSGFATAFSARGPKDAKGRSLRDLDLQSRLLKYPCSYMVYSPAFEALPGNAKTAVYDRMWRVLSGQVAGEPYTRLSLADRRAIVEILKATKPSLPAFFTDTIK
jgi:hypothetical protein